jgi:cytidine deaminase
MLFEFDDQYQNVPGVVESIDRVRLIDIDDEMAALEGCTADELRAGLRAGYYADLTDDAMVDFVSFRLAST